MKWFEPKTEAQRETLKAGGLESFVYNVCWRCGGGGHNKRTLYNLGKHDGRTVYGCQDHRGLRGQVQ